MVKSKKRYNTKKYTNKKNFLTKKNLRGGVVPFLVTNVNLLGISNGVEILNFNIDKLYESNYFSNTIRFFEKEREDYCPDQASVNEEDKKKRKIDYLLKVYQYIENKYKRQEDFFTNQTTNLKELVCRNKNTSIEIEYQKQTKDDEYTFYLPFLHGAHLKNAKLKKLPPKTYICFLTKFNNFALSLDEYNNVSHYFKNIDYETFKSISDNLSLYSVYDSLNIQEDIYSPNQNNYTECFKSSSWYYPYQYYLDLAICSDDDNKNFFYEILDDEGNKIIVNKIPFKKKMYLSDFIEEVIPENTFRNNVFFINACRPTRSESLEHINLYTSYEYFIRNLNREIQTNASDDQGYFQHSYSNVICGNISDLKGYIIYNISYPDEFYLSSPQSYNYDLNYHQETEILQEIHKKYNDNDSKGIIELKYINYISNLSPRKIIKFLEKNDYNKKLMNALKINIFKKFKTYTDNLSYYKKFSNEIYQRKIVTNLVDKLYFLYLKFSQFDDEDKFKIIFKDLMNSDNKLFELDSIDKYLKDQELYLSDVKITAKINTIFTKNVTKITLLNVETNRKLIHFKYPEKIEYLEIRCKNKIVSVLSLINKCINLKTLKLEEKGSLIENPKNLNVFNLLKLEFLELENIKIEGLFFVNNAGLLSNLKTLILTNTKLSFISLDNVNLKYFYFTRNYQCNQIALKNCSIGQLSIYDNESKIITLNTDFIEVESFLFKGNNLNINGNMTINKSIDLDCYKIKNKIKVKQLVFLKLFNLKTNILDVIESYKLNKNYMFQHLKYLEISNCPNIKNLDITYFSMFIGYLKVKCDRDLPVYKDLLKLSKQRNILFI